MGKKIALNILYNIGIFACLFFAYSGFQSSRYEYVVVAVFLGAILVVLKLRLIKEIRSTIKKP